jgi:16S rRNA (cytosine967-C5)-methyltransferase
LQNLVKRLKRSWLSNLHSQLISSEADPKLKRLNGKFDRVLVDAPCSGLGTLRRNPDLKWRQKPQDVLELTVKQTNILARAAKLVKAGGRLVYATCSLLQDENEVIADTFLKNNPDFVLVPSGPILQQQQINLDTGPYLKLLPHLHQTDGFFAAVFEKTAVKQVEKLDEIDVPSTSVDEEVLHGKAAAKAKNIAKSAAKTKLATKPKSTTKSGKKKA